MAKKVKIEVEEDDKKVTIETEETEAQKEETTEEVSDVEALEKQVAELKDKYLRLFAEFDNYKKRVAKERLELVQTAGKDIIIDMLPVVDDFDRAMSSIDEAKDIKAVKEGIDLIYNKLNNTLSKRGLTPMEAKGEAFDAELHEALTEIPAPSDDLKGKVVDVIEKGYTMNNKIIRYAKVVVGK